MTLTTFLGIAAAMLGAAVLISFTAKAQMARRIAGFVAILLALPSLALLTFGLLFSVAG